jgi:hypothetical protein
MTSYTPHKSHQSNRQLSIWQKPYCNTLALLVENSRKNLSKLQGDVMQRRLTKEWTAAAFDRVNNEWVHTTNQSYESVPEGIEQPFITQAAPTKITPSRAKPVEREHEVFGVLPDIQYGYREIQGELIPTHDEKAMAVARLVLKDARPNHIVLNGDNLDFANLSKYEADSNHFANTLQPSLDGMHRYLAELRADHPDADIHYLGGNHEARLVKTVLRYTAQLANIKPANMPDSWNVLSVPYLLRLDELGVNYYGGYPANEYENGNLLFIHGQSVRSGGSTAELYSKKYPEHNVFFGHVHRLEMHTRTRRNGEYLVSATFGTLADTTGSLPSYGNGVDDRGNIVKHQENWQQGMGIIRRYASQDIEVTPILIQDGTARLQGRQYDGRL